MPSNVCINGWTPFQYLCIVSLKQVEMRKEVDNSNMARVKFKCPSEKLEAIG